MDLERGIRAVASQRRLRVLELLKDAAVFNGPRDADGRPLGVTATALQKRLRIRQPSLTGQMQVLLDAGLVRSRRVGRFVVYARDEEGIRSLKQAIIDHLQPPPTSRAQANS